ncbi:MAG TPA: hypothetical protein VHW09_32530 [Bryobacteraceae bacterium]|jgi:hypothetical protein|nr:hypothetical protein [Bryobacteraceae bacterium]
MCDYSLMAVPNRLAHEGEELVTHRFPTGSLGMASPADIQAAITPRNPGQQSVWQKIRAFFDPTAAPAVCAVCLPPGAKLLICDIPPRQQQQWHVGECEEGVFTQISAAANTYRDAVRFPNGCEVRLQEFRERMRVKVLDLSGTEQVELETLRALG